MNDELCKWIMNIHANKLNILFPLFQPTDLFGMQPAQFK